MSNDESSGHEDDEHNKRSFKEQDRLLPTANIIRIMKRALPANAKVAKDAKITVQECVSEYISFITSEASDKCHQEKRKTITGDDIIWAMANLGFDNYVEPLRLYLQKYRESVVQSEKQSKRSSRDNGSTSGPITTNPILFGSAELSGSEEGPVYNNYIQQGPSTQTQNDTNEENT